MNNFLTHDAAAAHIQVCPKTLRALRQQGLIPYVAVTKRKKLYRIEDLDAYLASRLTTEVYVPTERRGPAKRLRNAPNVVSFSARPSEMAGKRPILKLRFGAPAERRGNERQQAAPRVPTYSRSAPAA